MNVFMLEKKRNPPPAYTAYILKGYFTQKCLLAQLKNVLTLMSFQTCEFLSYVEHKKDVLKNAVNQTVDCPCWLP